MRMRTAALISLFVLGLVNHVFADEVVNGRFGPGALYRLVRPTNWNGSLLCTRTASCPVAPRSPYRRKLTCSSASWCRRGTRSRSRATRRTVGQSRTARSGRINCWESSPRGLACLPVST